MRKKKYKRAPTYGGQAVEIVLDDANAPIIQKKTRRKILVGTPTPWHISSKIDAERWKTCILYAAPYANI